MTPEDKELLLKDICARLPYGVKITDGLNVINANSFISIGIFVCDGKWKPYLRPMSSMTEEEDTRKRAFLDDIEGGIVDAIPNYIGWLNTHHFDYRGLSEKGLAIEAPKGMYN